MRRCCERCRRRRARGEGARRRARLSRRVAVGRSTRATRRMRAHANVARTQIRAPKLPARSLTFASCSARSSLDERYRFPGCAVERREQAVGQAGRRSGSSSSSMRPSSASASFIGSIGMRAKSGACASSATRCAYDGPKISYCFAGIGRDEVRHVLDDAENRFLQLMDEVGGLAHDHRRQRLRHRDEHDAVDRKRLQHGQRRVGGSRRKVDEQKVELAPEHLFVKLTDDAGDDRAAPDHRGIFAIGEQIRADDLDRAARDRRRHQRLRLALRRRLHRIGLDRRAVRAVRRAFGIDGPVMSASRMPTRKCFRRRPIASIAVTSDFPTPPLPDMIGIACAIFARPANAPGARAAGRRASSAIGGTLPERRASCERARRSARRASRARARPVRSSRIC